MFNSFQNKQHQEKGENAGNEEFLFFLTLNPINSKKRFPAFELYLNCRLQIV